MKTRKKEEARERKKKINRRKKRINFGFGYNFKVKVKQLFRKYELCDRLYFNANHHNGILAEFRDVVTGHVNRLVN